MALSDLAVFSEYVYSAMTEVLRQQVNLFNAASRGTIALRSAAHVGDFSDVAFWAKVNGLVRRRNPYGSGTVAEKNLQQIVDTMVKVAAGTPPIRIDPGQFNWIQRNPEEGGAVIGQQLAVDTMADMLNTAILATAAAMSGVAAINYDGTAAVADVTVFNHGQALFGDAYQDILAWIMHSKPLFDVYDNALQNTNGLFTFGTVNVRQDGFGRVFIVTDSPSLMGTPVVGPPAYTPHLTLGLVAGAIRVDQNGDFTDNIDTLNGEENIKRTYQAEWSYELGIKGFAWDNATGAKAPNDAALGTATNWDRYATSEKDLAGVMIATR
jgi:hypothetical protein